MAYLIEFYDMPAELCLNRTAELANWDMATLGNLLESLRTENALANV